MNLFRERWVKMRSFDNVGLRLRIAGESGRRRVGAVVRLEGDSELLIGNRNLACKRLHTLLISQRNCSARYCRADLEVEEERIPKLEELNTEAYERSI